MEAPVIESAKREPAPKSTPCVGLCRMRSERCVGCGRSIEQIQAWGRLDEAERWRQMETLATQGFKGAIEELRKKKESERALSKGSGASAGDAGGAG